jgi:two-component system chemotaxis response regulator CheB
MLFEKQDNDKVTVKLDDGALENFCKPAVDPMLRSLIDIYGDRILFAMLTGMGSDGLEGCKALVQKNGYLIAQDAETSVVWGMPGAVAKEGLCSAVLPVEEIGPWIKSKVS